MRKKSPAGAPAHVQRILAIDIGGSGLKAAILDREGEMQTERLRVETPHPCKPPLLVSTLSKLVAPLAPYQVVSVGFPGVVRDGVVRTAPNLGKALEGFDLQDALQKKLGAPVRVLNDADMQGLAAVRGRGVEVVVTLGTGFGSAFFVDGKLGPHLEISHHPLRKDETYDQQLGDEARRSVGAKKWNRRVREAIDNLRILTNFDHLYVGGGNAKKINFELPKDVSIVANELGIRGGAWLWRDGDAGPMR